MLTFPQETVEYLPVTVEVDGTPTIVFEVATPVHGGRPTEWAAAPLLLEDMEPGWYDAYTRVTDSPEIPVNFVGTFAVTGLPTPA